MLTVKQIYNLAIDLGINNDLRGPKFVKEKLIRTKAKFEKLSKNHKEEFDQEKLTNPFSDTRYFGDPEKKVKRVLAGIDIETGEIMMAKELSKNNPSAGSGRGPIDLIIGHHPMGLALAGLDEVMDLQVELLAKYGVPINIAENLTQTRMSEVARGVAAYNHNQAVDAARLMGIDLMCVHTPADNLVANFLNKEIQKQKNKLVYVEDLLKLLRNIPEYRQAMKYKNGPKLFVGRSDRYLGKIALTEITGGTSNNKEMYSKMSQAGIGTIIGMHIGEEHRKEAEAAHLNVIIAGHMSSDSLGMNLFLDELEKKGIEVIPCSGLIRHKRIK